MADLQTPLVTPSINDRNLDNGVDEKLVIGHGVTNGNGLDSLTDSSTFDVTSTDSDLEQSTAELDASNTVTSITSESDSQSQGLSGVTPIVNGGSHGSRHNCEPVKEESNSSELTKSNVESSNSDQEKNSNGTKSSFPDLNTADWYNNPCFQRYWKFYYQSMAWCQKHKDTVKHIGESSQNPPTSTFKWPSSFHYNPYPLRGCPYNLFTRPGARGRFLGRGLGRGRGRGRGKCFQGQAKTRNTNDLESSTCEASQDMSDSDSEVYEMEITDEMLEFFAKSEQHRKERDAQKEDVKHVVLEGGKADQKAPTTEAPKEQPGVRRTAEMNQLYGKGAAMIHGMETALQMTFDRNMDILQPKMWPNMPLKITFS